MLSLTELLVTTVLALLCYTLLKWYHSRQRLFRTFADLGIPGPVPGFWLGNLRFSNRDYVFNHLETWFRRYGDYFGYFRGDRPVIVVRDLEMIQEVFVSRFGEFPNRLRFSMDVVPFSSSVLALRDKRWRHVRRIITPAFTAHKVSQHSVAKSISISIKRVFEVLRSGTTSAITVDYLDDIGSGPRTVINANYLSKVFTLDVICRIGFALDQTDVFEPNSKLVDMVEEFMANCDGPLIRLVFMFPFLARLLELINNHLTSGRAVDMLSKHLNSIFQKYQVKEHLEVPNEDQEDELNSSIKKRNVLDYILFQGKVANLSHNETIGNLLVILFAGYETTACCLTFTLFNLAKHPDIQKRLRVELRSSLNLASKDVSLDELLDQLLDLKCEYLDRVIYETLRLYPPVIDYTMREIGGDLDEVTLKCGLRVPKGVAVQLPVWAMHHDAAIWPEPYQFNPDRENLPIPGSKVKNVAFAAFGVGQRSCIGGNLAMMEMRHMITTLLMRYQIELVSDPRSRYAHNYRYDQHRLLQIECNAELIKPKEDIYLQLVSI